jgi:hypothetical protein
MYVCVTCRFPVLIAIDVLDVLYESQSSYPWKGKM